jgi:hypothetical protein
MALSLLDCCCELGFEVCRVLVFCLRFFLLSGASASSSRDDIDGKTKKEEAIRMLATNSMAMLSIVGLQKAIVAEKLSVAGFSSVAV